MIATGTALALSALASAGTGIASAAMNKPKSSTGTSSQNTNYDNTSTTTRNLTPDQQSLESPLTALAMEKVTNPAGRLQPLKEGTKAAVNRNFAGADEAIRTALGRSGAKSGKLGTAVRQTQLARLGALSGVDTNFSTQVLNEQESGANLAERLLSQNYGSTTTGSGTNASTGTGTQTAAPIGGMGVAGNAIGSGLETAMTLMMINQMLKPKYGIGTTV